MALKKPANFEAENNTTGEDSATEAATPAVNMQKARATAEPDAPAEAQKAPAAETQVARTSSTQLSLNEAANAAKAFKKEVEDMKGASDFSFGNYSVFKGDNGQIDCKETKDNFGRWVKVRLMGWDDHHEISPGETGASTKDFVAYSKDGKTIDSVIGEEQKSWVGKSVADYANYLRDDEEFSKTKVRRFIDTACYVLGSDSGDGPLGSTVQITLSESSIPAFARHQQELSDKARAVAMGLPGATMPADPFTFYFLREVTSKGQNTWTKLRIVSELPARI